MKTWFHAVVSLWQITLVETLWVAKICGLRSTLTQCWHMAARGLKEVADSLKITWFIDSTVIPSFPVHLLQCDSQWNTASGSKIGSIFRPVWSVFHHWAFGVWLHLAVLYNTLQNSKISQNSWRCIHFTYLFVFYHSLGSMWQFKCWMCLWQDADKSQISGGKKDTWLQALQRPKVKTDPIIFYDCWDNREEEESNHHPPLSMLQPMSACSVRPEGRHWSLL